MALKREAGWYKDAIIYQIHVRAFFDSNGDGIGDFQGLAQKLDYVQELGVNAIWLMPFFPSPLRDDGYDISDYRSVHPSYGTLEDFKAFLSGAHDRGIRRLVCVERYRYEVSRSPNHLRRYRNVELGLGSCFQVLLLASLLQSSARSELRQSRGTRRDVEGNDLLAGTRSRWFPAGCCPLPD